MATLSSSTNTSQPDILAPEPAQLPPPHTQEPPASTLAINIAEGVEALLLTSGLDVQKLVVSPNARLCSVI